MKLRDCLDRIPSRVALLCAASAMLLTACINESSVAVFDSETARCRALLPYVGGDVDEEVVGMSAKDELFLTSREIESWSAEGNVVYPHISTVFVLRDLYTKIHEMKIDFPVYESRCSPSPKCTRVIVETSSSLRGCSKAAGGRSDAMGDGAVGNAMEKPGLSLYCVELKPRPNGDRSVVHLLNLPSADYSHTVTWVDEDRIVVAYSDGEDGPIMDERALRRGCYLIDVRTGRKTELNLPCNTVQCGWDDLEARKYRYANLHQDHALGPMTHPVACSGGGAERLVVPNTKHGLLIFDLPSLAVFAHIPGVKLPFAAVDCDKRIVLWGCGEWASISIDGELTEGGNFSGMSILGYLGHDLFYCEKDEERTDRSRWARLGLECKKYVVNKSGEVVATLDYARWLYGRFGEKMFFVRWN